MSDVLAAIRDVLDRAIPDERKLATINRLVNAPAEPTPEPVREPADVREVLEWYKARNWPCIVGLRGWLPTASGEVVELGQGYVVLDGHNSRVNVPLREVRLVQPTDGCPDDAPWWAKADAEPGGQT